MSGAVVIAGALIAVAIIWTQQKPVSSNTAATTDSLPNPLSQVTMAPISSSDHIYGNPNAPVKIVEYSDPSCPYCQAFNPVMEQIVAEYGATGQVAWVYRQFPLDKPGQDGKIFHPNSGRQAEALECAAAVGGSTAFWAYEKAWFGTYYPQDGAQESSSVSDQQIAATAKDVKLDPIAFNDCISSERFKARLDAQYTDGINVGVAGTPTSVLVTPTGSKILLPGLQTYTTLKTAIETLLPHSSQ